MQSNPLTLSLAKHVPCIMSGMVELVHQLRLLLPCLLSDPLLAISSELRIYLCMGANETLQVLLQMIVILCYV